MWFLGVENVPLPIRLDRQSTLCYKVAMNTIRRAIATTELLLLFPAVLFMTSLFAQNVQEAQCEPAQTARRVVEWFSARPLLGLDVFLIVMPFAAFVIGCATVLRTWRSDAKVRHAARETIAVVRAHLATVLIAGATLTAGCILAIVALHMTSE
jgi:hypothetical protein